MTGQLLSEASGLEVSVDTLRRLEMFCDLVRKWNPRINLVAKASIEDIWVRHIVDSAQLYRFAPQVSPLWADLGSGGGFPGVILAVLSRQAAPDRRHVLIESDQRKAVFLREAARALDCRIMVVSDRIEHVDVVSADVVTARALAPLPQLLGLVARHLKPDGTAILPKGAAYDEELASARANWCFDVNIHDSVTGAGGHILQISGLRARIEGQ
ncbi:16S rRNA (guanine(527)-N(7))-methyltransferase RsmG [Gemmobacter sp.]|uniref:16S rRNA (guanine(527)-N(7))-methyltransferase RsmG n=1 Tax=Gemmobacter sp. TaxID=1898957 RepID=UPI002AFDF44C|nr:16S rRNA (guanine(527)-N(7))-methyltransferase RsmG [Gemmobacter sp.]